MNAEQNITVSLPQLIQLLAELTGVDAAESRKFLHEFFALVEDALVQGNSVKIKGIGSFAVVDRDSGAVSFTPDSELASAVNTPFAMFEPMELGDGISPEDLAEEAPQAPETKEDKEDKDDKEKKEEYVLAIDTQPDEETESDIIAQAETETETEVVAEPEKPEEPEEAECDVAEDTTEITAEDTAEDTPEDGTEEATGEYHPQLYDTEAEPAHRSIKGYVATALLGIAAGFVIGYYTHEAVYRHYCIEAAPIEIIENQPAVPADSTEVSKTVEETPEPAAEVKAPAIVKDTVSRNYFLASMARRHYGHMEYWVYIYEANPGLGHPDRIKPGTVVTIPAAADFAQSSDSATMAHALRLYADIYSRYK